jgi:predicted nucleotidyltransferase
LHTQQVTPELLTYIINKIVSEIAPRQIVLFGSRARNEAGPESDIDLFIVQDQSPSNREVRRKIEYLLWGRLFGVDLIVRTPEEVKINLDKNNSFYTEHIFGQGKVLYERSG